LYSDALVAFVGNDNERARDAIQKVLSGNPDHLPSLLMSGLVNFRLGSFAVAEDALRKVAARMPGDSGIARTLAEFYIRTGRGMQAVEALQPALQRTPQDPMLQRALGEAQLAAGNPAQAIAAYERATAQDSGNAASKVRLAQVRLAAGDTAKAFSDLEALSASDESALPADITLYTAHLRRREFDKALATADAIAQKQPGTPLALFLRGNVYLAKRDLPRARAAFDAALKVQPDYYAAGYGLGIIDLQEGHPELARARYDKMLEKNPKNEQVLIASAELQAMMGASPDQVRSAFDKAIAANPSSRGPRVAMVGYLTRINDRPAAAAAAQSAVAAIPNDVQMLDLLGVTQLAIDPRQAVETYKRIVSVQPQNALAYVRLAEVETVAKDYESALVNARKALSLKPDLAQAYAALVRTYVLSGKPEEALEEAHKLQKRQPAKALGYALEGDIYLAQRQFAKAADAMNAALAREAQPMIATRVYATLTAAGKTGDAEALAKKWVSDHPKDLMMPLYLAQLDLQRKNLGAAASAYQRVLADDPDNTMALNNLAWILTEQGDPKGLVYAEQAHRLSPMNPSVIDTLGSALMRNGQVKRGVDLLRMAVAMAPGNADSRLHYAKSLLQAGDKATAKQELTALSKFEQASDARAEAQKLLATL
jgi:putative PEP-CTERM system TPR-repeat lipoprotein